MSKLKAKKRAATIEQIERNLLRTFCQSGGVAHLPPEILRDLRNYRWQGMDHQTIFDVLLSSGTRVVARRERLAAQATRMGFPDINWSDYFQPWARGKGELKRSATELVRRLKATMAQKR